MKRFYWLICLLPLGATAQMKINANSLVAAQGMVSTNTSIINESLNADFSNAEVFLNGGNLQASTTQPLIVSSLIINNGGIKDLSGLWEVTTALELANGILRVNSGSKLVYSGTSSVTGGSNQSYVDGFIYLNNTATNRRFVYPVGVSGMYLPIAVEAATAGELGMRVVAGDAGFSLPAEVSDYLRGWYWEATDAPNSIVSLSLNNASSFLGSSAPMVLAGDATGGSATALGGTPTGSDVTSVDPSAQPIMTIGKGVEFNLVIHDMITPYIQDAVNDKLFIENIELTESNRVKLMDRYGVVVREWTDYNNDIDEDFSTLSPGNYVCLVEFVYPGSSSHASAKGVVTVLKSN